MGAVQSVEAIVDKPDKFVMRIIVAERPQLVFDRTRLCYGQSDVDGPIRRTGRRYPVARIRLKNATWASLCFQPVAYSFRQTKRSPVKATSTWVAI